jgi:protein O-GlcNAc transferase
VAKLDGVMTIPELIQRGLQHLHASQLAEAEAIAQQILAQQPDQLDAVRILGLIACMRGRIDDALALLGPLAARHPEVAELHCNYGTALALSGKTDEAIAAFRRAIAIGPANADMFFNLADALCRGRQWQEAIATFERASALRPHDAGSHGNYAMALTMVRRFSEAVQHAREILAISPDQGEAFNTLGMALRGLGDFDGAMAAYERATALMPGAVDTLNNLANIYREGGRLGRAIDTYQRAVDLDPRRADIAGTRLYALHFDPDYDAPRLLAEHQKWNERYGEPLRGFIRPHDNDRSPDRRLRIGYVSPDLRSHVVGINLFPLLEKHDRARFEVFCYASVAVPDDETERLRAQCDGWRDIYSLSDEQAAALIRQDRIDILVDLTLHMPQNRLLIFARKPAPVQATYLGYCSTTGLTAMDYRLSDPHLDPPDGDMTVYSEQTVRLPASYWCYHPKASPEVKPAPAAANGYVTFGCLNSFSKVSAAALDLWAEVMRRVPRSRLVLHCHSGAYRQVVLDRFAAQGITADRIDLVGFQRWNQYIQTYDRIDVALDPFPYGGGITTCDALWMGVPVVTLSGRTAVGRGGASIMANLGLPELVARTGQEYAQLACEFDRWIPRRPLLRQRMQDSPLMDDKGLARSMEAIYRTVWEKWARAS